MKILFYINVLGGGGAERVIVNLANRFSQETNSEVTLIASYPVPNEYVIDDSVQCIFLPKKLLCFL